MDPSGVFFTIGVTIFLGIVVWAWFDCDNDDWGGLA